MRYFYLILLGGLFSLIVVSCKENRALQPMYVGSTRVLDQTIPYPYILYNANDSLFLINNKAQRIGYSIRSEFKTNDTLIIGEKHFYIANKKSDKFYVFDLNDTLTFQRYKNGHPIQKDVASFIKVDKTILKVKVEKLQDLLKSQTWKQELINDLNPVPNRDLKVERFYGFSEKQITQLTKYFYQGEFISSEYQCFKYKLFKIQNSLFLSFIKDEDNPQPIFQFINIGKNQIELKDYSSKEPLIIKLAKAEKDDRKKFDKSILESKKYANCFDGYQGEYYFRDDVTYIKGNNFILNYVNEKAPLDNIEKSGYIIVHFNVNCYGEVGNFGLIQMTRAYKPTTFSKKLVKHLIKKVSNLNEWPSTQSTEDWLRYKDVHAFLMFKVEHGKIVDLCP